MKSILVVGGGEYQVPLIKRIKELGYHVFCVDKNSDAPGFIYSDGFRIIDILDKEACLSYAKNLKINGIATYGATITLPTVSFIGEKMNLRTLYPDTAQLAINKYKIKKQLIYHGCNTKGVLKVFHNTEEVEDAMIEYPCVVKPSDGSGSKGVSIVWSDSQLKPAILNGFKCARFGEIYVEGFINGDEYSVEVFVDDGIILMTTIIKTSFTRFDSSNLGISYGHRTPPGIDFFEEKIINNEIEKAVKALKINMGSANFDVIFSKEDRKAYIIDCGMRVGQNLIASHIIPLSRGINEMDLYISQVINSSISPLQLLNKCIATRLLIANPGTVLKINPFQHLIGQNGIVEIVLRKQVGDIQKKYLDKSDNCGWVICTGDTPDEAEKNAEKARVDLLKRIVIT